MELISIRKEKKNVLTFCCSRSLSSRCTSHHCRFQSYLRALVALAWINRRLVENDLLSWQEELHHLMWLLSHPKISRDSAEYRYVIYGVYETKVGKYHFHCGHMHVASAPQRCSSQLLRVWNECKPILVMFSHCMTIDLPSS